MKDVGTLKEIGAKPGDVVEAQGGEKPTYTVGANKYGKLIDVADGEELCEYAPFRIVSRAYEVSTHRIIPVFVAPGYDSLFNVLTRALEQAQGGKGKERHAQPGQAFEDQPIIQIGKLIGMGFQTGQAIKKAVEAQGMVRRGDFNAAEREILGAINYLAAVAIEINQRATAAE